MACSDIDSYHFIFDMEVAYNISYILKYKYDDISNDLDLFSQCYSFQM